MANSGNSLKKSQNTYTGSMGVKSGKSSGYENSDAFKNRYLNRTNLFTADEKKRLVSAKQLEQADEYYVRTKFKLSPEDIMKIEEAVVDSKLLAGIDMSICASIIGLPPMPDNIVDPPFFNSPTEYSGMLDTCSTGKMGKNYTQRVLERGQFLTLSPIELQPDKSELISQAIASVAGGGGNFAANLHGVENRMNITSYGYVTRFATRRYWRSVITHMKAAMFALGIDDLSKDHNVKAYLSKYLPEFLVENVYASNDLENIKSIIQQGYDEKSEAELAEEAIQRASYESGEGKAAKFVGAIGDAKGAIDAAVGTSDSISGFIQGLNNAFSKFSSSNYKGTSDDSTAGTKAPYTDGFMYLMRYVANIDLKDEINKKLPFTVYYVNGAIDRSLGFSLEAQTSQLAQASLSAGKKLKSGGLNMVAGGIMGTFSDLASGGDDGKSQDIAKASDSLSGIEAYAQEYAYHNSGKLTSAFLVNNIYVPKVMTGGSTELSYTVPIRQVSVGSTPFDVARVMWLWATIQPYIIQTSMPRRALIIPTSALYCMAFSKGVINAPKAYISNVSIKTDPAFLTTYGAPTELDLTLTIQPLFTITTMPDFNKFWGTGDVDNAASLIGAMWHPMSSMNIMATLCGQNTILTAMPGSILEFFIGGAVTKFANAIKGTYYHFRAQFRDFSDSKEVQLNNKFQA